MENIGIDEAYLDVTDIPDTNEEITGRIKDLLIDNAQGFGL
jgi:hypothetical protein